MTDPDDTLLRHLGLALLAKLAALVLLWWLFVRDSGVPVDASAAAQRIGPGISHQEESK